MTSGPEPATTVVIPHYRADTLSDCLDSLYRHSDRPVRVLVVDDGGGGPALESARGRFPRMEVLSNDRRLGFTGSCNRGLEAAETPFALLLNDDTRVTPGWLAPLEDAASEAPEVAVCQPKLLWETRPGYFDPSGAAGGYIDRLGYTFCRGRVFDTVERDEGQYDGRRELFWACGTAMFLRLEAVREVGPLDLDYFMHFEEIDLCWRLRLAGWRILAVPESRIFHHAARSLPADSFRKAYLNHRNNLVALIKNLPARRLLWLLPVRVLLELLACVRYAVRRPLCAAAPLAGLAWIAAHPGNLWRRRRDSRRLAAAGRETGDAGVFPGSVLIHYYLLRRRTASALMGEP